ncbi:mucin-15 [Sceloporus undulatus]|uniref:mucin-15 n=1 Tax=Sceloporus undulatus TaxID=8520 RepID=UPI001C4A9707|nr:mucin-15 [Sceloporus undulatus]
MRFTKMMVSKGLMFTLLLASLQWTRNNSVKANISTFSINNSNSTTMNPSTFTVTSGITPVTVTSPTDISDSIRKTTGMESSTQNSGINPTSSLNMLLSQNTHNLNFTKEGDNHSAISINSTSVPSGMPTNSNYLSTTISKSAETTVYVTSSETRSNNYSTATYNANFTSMVSSNKTQMDYTTVHPTNNLLNASVTMLTTKSNSITAELWLTSQTTSLHSNFSDSSAEAREHQKENHSHGAVVFGAIVGAALGSALIGLVGYFMCGKRKTESFGHQRLYDDTRSDPVLRLDSTPEPYDMSYYNLTMAKETAAQNSKEKPYDTIPMDDLASSHPTA